MKKNIINFLKSKGLFSLWLLAIIIVGEISDFLEYNPKWSFIKFLTFLGYYFLFFLVWMAVDVLSNKFKSKALD